MRGLCNKNTLTSFAKNQSSPQNHHQPCPSSSLTSTCQSHRPARGSQIETCTTPHSLLCRPPIETVTVLKSLRSSPSLPVPPAGRQGGRKSRAPNPFVPSFPCILLASPRLERKETTSSEALTPPPLSPSPHLRLLSLPLGLLPYRHLRQGRAERRKPLSPAQHPPRPCSLSPPSPSLSNPAPPQPRPRRVHPPRPHHRQSSLHRRPPLLRRLEDPKSRHQVGTASLPDGRG